MEEFQIGDFKIEKESKFFIFKRNDKRVKIFKPERFIARLNKIEKNIETIETSPSNYNYIFGYGIGRVVLRSDDDQFPELLFLKEDGQQPVILYYEEILEFIKIMEKIKNKLPVEEKYRIGFVTIEVVENLIIIKRGQNEIKIKLGERLFKKIDKVKRDVQTILDDPSTKQYNFGYGSRITIRTDSNGLAIVLFQQGMQEVPLYYDEFDEFFDIMYGYREFI